MISLKKQPDIDLTEAGEDCRVNGFNLIRRQDVIEICMEQIESPINTYFEKGIAEIIKKKITELPSADTDLSEYSDKLWKNAYERGKAEAQQWIPCSERLPDKQGYYLVWAKYDFKDESWYDIQLYDDDCEAFGYWEEHYDTETFGYLDSEFVELRGIVAWIPLPEPWKEKENDE